MKLRAAALCFLLCLLLTACSGEREEGPSPILGRAAEISEEETLLTVDGRAVPGWRYLYWLAYTCDRIRDRYQETGGTLDWQTAVAGGTLADYAKDQALADTALYATVENWADKYGCTLAEPDQEILTAQWEEQAAERGGEAAYLADLASLGLDRQRAEELAGVGLLYGKLWGLSGEADSPLAPKQEDLIHYGEEQGVLTVDRILVAAGEDREAARQRAAKLFAQLNDATDQATVFGDLAAAGDDPAGPRTLLPEEKLWSGTLLDAAKALGEGQCSGILESEEGFSILRRLPLDPEALTEDYFDHMLQRGAEQAVVETEAAYGDLDAAAFYQALADLRAAGRKS